MGNNPMRNLTTARVRANEQSRLSRTRECLECEKWKNVNAFTKGADICNNCRNGRRAGDKE